MSLVDELNRTRASQGLLSIEEVISLGARDNVVFDPFSVLISRSVVIGTGNVFYSCTTLLCRPGCRLRIGNNNIFRPMFSSAAESGDILIGSDNEFGDGGVFLKANRPGAEITIGDRGRYLGGATIMGASDLGTGSQVLGAVTVDSCRLEAGGSYWEPDPDLRAGLLKGQGSARGLSVPVGHVISGQGPFSQADIKTQASFHARPG